MKKVKVQSESCILVHKLKIFLISYCSNSSSSSSSASSAPKLYLCKKLQYKLFYSRLIRLLLNGIRDTRGGGNEVHLIFTTYGRKFSFPWDEICHLPNLVFATQPAPTPKVFNGNGDERMREREREMEYKTIKRKCRLVLWTLYKLKTIKDKVPLVMKLKLNLPPSLLLAPAPFKSCSNFLNFQFSNNSSTTWLILFEMTFTFSTAARSSSIKLENGEKKK